MSRPDVVPGPAPQTGVWGTDVWHTLAGQDWSYWDLWFCAVCSGDHGGDWDAMDAAIQQARQSSWGEALWCHLVDLTGRLEAAGLTAADLVAACPTTRGLRPKARTKIFKSEPSRHERTPPMRDLPSRRLRRRAMFGAWDQFPRSPRSCYDALSARFDLERRPYWDGWATHDMVFDMSAAVDRLAREAKEDPVRILAARRAALTLYYEVAVGFDDSYGAAGDVAHDAVRAYASTDWCMTGIDPEVYWRDLLAWSIHASDYGLTDRIEVEVLRDAGARQHLDLVETILSELADEYAAARIPAYAAQATVFRALTVVAADAFPRFEATVMSASTATASGEPNWIVLAAMIDAAVAQHETGLAIRLLDLADIPGAGSRRRDWIHQRRAELAT